MNFTNHAKLKLSLYGVSEEEVNRNSSSVLFDCEDVVEDSRILIIIMHETHFALVCSKILDRVITIYTTDLTTINNRRKSGRWDCH